MPYCIALCRIAPHCTKIVLRYRAVACSTATQGYRYFAVQYGTYTIPYSTAKYRTEAEGYTCPPTMLFSTVQHYTIPYSAALYHTAQCSTIPYRTVQHYTIPGTVQCSTVPYSTVQHYAIQYSTALYHTVQCSTIPYRTVQHYTIPYSAALYHTV